jgi:phosphoenolpyruvate-protein kinase (PTS system EI component)
VLRLIHLTIQAGAKAGIPVSVCGEMAGDPDCTRLLIGMGLRQFSMHPAQILEVKQAILRADAADLGPRCSACSSSTSPTGSARPWRNSSAAPGRFDLPRSAR